MFVSFFRYFLDWFLVPSLHILHFFSPKRTEFAICHISPVIDPSPFIFDYTIESNDGVICALKCLKTFSLYISSGCLYSDVVKSPEFVMPANGHTI